MDYIIPALLKKTITFQRLKAKNVIEYQIYAQFKDDTYDSGLRTELLETIPNPNTPDVHINRIALAYNSNATWELPYDAYLDRDHQFRLFLNDFILSSMCYKYNRLTKLITLDTISKEYSINDKMEMEYYQDLITRSYMFETNGEIFVKPIFTESYSYGSHNIIV